MVCFVILHYIALDQTILCIESIKNNVIGEKKIVVVDNASPNGSVKGLKDRYDSTEDVKVIETGSNLGFAKGNNYGYKYAVNHYSPEFIVVMNNDMEIYQAEFIEGIRISYEQYQYHIMGPDIYSTKKRYHQNPQTRKLPTKKRLEKDCKKLWIKNHFNFLIAIKWWINEIRGNKVSESYEIYKNRAFVKEVRINQMLHGSCYIFSPLFIERHNDKCFYDKTFMYMEAEILYYLSMKNNEKIIYYPFIKVNHYEDVSTDAKFKSQYRKSIFSVKCLYHSCKAFLDLMNQYEEL